MLQLGKLHASLAGCGEEAGGLIAQVLEETAKLLFLRSPLLQAARAGLESCAASPSWSLSLCLCTRLTIQE